MSLATVFYYRHQSNPKQCSQAYLLSSCDAMQSLMVLKTK